MNSLFSNILFFHFKPKHLTYVCRFIVAIIFFYFINGVLALRAEKRVNFSKLTLNEGLIDYNIQTFAQDTFGFIWMGGKLGIQRFDGAKVTIFKPDPMFYGNRSSLIVNKLLLHNSLLWCTSTYGLLCLNIQKEKFVPIQYDIDSLIENVYDITYFNNKYWLSTDRGLFSGVFNDKTSTFNLLKINLNNKIADKSVLSKILKIWFVDSTHFYGMTNYMLGEFILKNDSLIWSIKRPIKGVDIKSLINNELNSYVLTESSIRKFGKKGISIDTSKVIFSIDSKEIKQKFRVNNVHFYDQIIDRLGILWVSSNVGLIKIVDNSTNPEITLYRKSDNNQYSLSSDKLLGLFIDKSNILWIGSLTGGSNFLDLNRTGIEYFDEIDTEINSFIPIKTIQELDNGTILLGTDNYGIRVLKKDGTSYFWNNESKPNPISGNNILSIIENKNDVWIASRSGIDLVNKITGEVTYLNEYLANFTVNGHRFINFCSDKMGNVWFVTTLGKLYRIKKIASDNFNLSEVVIDSLLQRNKLFEINNITSDTTNNELLIGTSLGMLQLKLSENSTVKQTNQFQYSSEYKYSISNNEVQQILKVNDSTYFLSLSDFSINKIIISSNYEPYGYKSYIIEEPRGESHLCYKNLILYNDKLYFFDNALNSYDPKTNVTSRLKLKFKLSFDYILKNSCSISNGYLYVGTSSGFLRYKLESSNYEYNSSSLQITEIYINYRKLGVDEEFNGRKILDKSIMYSQALKLRSNENNIELLFSDPDPTKSHTNLYHYKLEGFDKKWHVTQTNKISYTNLDPGIYTLKISNSSNNSNFKSLQIEIQHSFWVRWYMILLYLIAGIIVVIITIINASRRIQMTNQLEINKEVNKLKLQFFTNITHDLKTPLSLIIAPSEELLKENFTEPINYKINLIHKNATRLLLLVNELLNFRKSEFELFSLEVEYCNPNLFLQELVAYFQEEAIRKGILLHFTPCEAEFKTWIDKERINKIVSNLISNALKYTSENGAVGVKIVTDTTNFEGLVKNTVFKTRSNFVSKKYFGIIVSDTGVGISKESLPNIFERFYQVTEDRSKHLGAGVGLSIVKNLVLQHKGEILVSSDRDRGTMFLVKLPLGDEFLTANDKKIESSSVNYSIEANNNEKFTEYVGSVKKQKHKKASILFVEDNEDLRSYLKNSFNDEFLVYDAENGQVGYELTLKHLPDVIISDIGMPIMNGIELCTQIKSDIRVSHIPFIMLTAKSAENSVVEGFLTGADRYISKPFSTIVLKANIDSLLKNNLLLKKKFETGLQSIQYDDEIPTIEKEFLTKLYAIVHNKINDPLFSIDHLSTEMGLSVRSLQMKLKSMAGISPLEIIRNVRLEKAAILLKNSDLRISDIGFEVGFVSAAHFTKCFKDKYGVSPKEYAHR